MNLNNIIGTVKVIQIVVKMVQSGKCFTIVIELMKINSNIQINSFHTTNYENKQISSININICPLLYTISLDSFCYNCFFSLFLLSVDTFITIALVTEVIDYFLYAFLLNQKKVCIGTQLFV